MRPTEDILADLEERDLLELATTVASRYHVTVALLCSPTRRAPIPVARGALWLLLRARGYTWTAIARVWGMDHTTVMAAVDRAADAGGPIGALMTEDAAARGLSAGPAPDLKFLSEFGNAHARAMARAALLRGA